MQRLPLSALRAFAAVYESGGVRPAARTLQVTHSSVSRHLHELEAWLGVALLENRSTKGRFAFTPHLVLRAAAEGLGVALARDRLAVDDLATGVLFRPFANTKVSVPRAYWLVQPPDEERRPAVLAVAQWIKAQARPELVPPECV